MNEENATANEQAERALLGAIIENAEKIMPLAIKKQCKTEWFTTGPHQNLWDVIQHLHINSKPIDMISIINWATNDGRLAEIEPITHDCIDECVTVAHAEYYLEVVEEKYFKRKIQSVMIEHLDLVDSNMEFLELASKLKYDIEAIEKHSIDELSKGDIYTLIMAIDKKTEEEGVVGIPSRWIGLQRKIGGYKRKKMCVIAARPSKGKTSTALNEARNMAEEGFKVGLISLETDSEEVYETLAADKAEVDLFKRANEGWDEDERKKFDSRLKEVLDLPIYLSTKCMDIRNICNWIRFMKNKYDLDAVFVDYIGIISPLPEEQKLPDRVKISNWSKQLFRVFRECDIAGIVLCQINRAGEPPPNAKLEDRWKYVPRLHHLKDTGAIEEDAYHVILLYPEPTESDLSDYVKIPYIFDVAKHKRGPTGRVRMLYEKDIQRMTNK